MKRRDFLIASAGLSATAHIAKNSELFASPTSQQWDVQKQNWNDKIKHDRSVALNILKPTDNELQHGFELHYNSLVIEQYGFGAFSAEDGDAIRKAVESGASEAEIDAMQESMERTRCVTNQAEQAEFMEAWQASGVTCVFQNAGREGNAVDWLLRRFAHSTYVTDMMKDFIIKASSPDDIVSAKKQNKHCYYLTCNAVPMPMDWNSLNEELGFIEVFYQLGARMMHLTYNRRNMIGDGCAETSNAGLSDFGRAVIKEMNRLGVIVDCAHSGWQTSLEAAQVSDKPIVASHTTCNSLYEHFRAKPDNVIKAIADKGGLIGICCVPQYLGGHGNISVMLDHIDYVVQKFGIDHVAIATDVGYNSRHRAHESTKIPKIRATRPIWEQYWPPETFEKKPEMKQSMAWTNWPLFTVGLVQRGYSDEHIQKIIGGNALRVAREVFDVEPRPIQLNGVRNN
jgi:membrane dipeptidase